MKSSARNSKRKHEKPALPSTGKAGYLMIGVAVAMIALSYTGMYIENSVDGVFSLVVSPVLLLLAYGLVLVGILWRKPPR
ncbi:MAG: hypothetical protein UMU76_00445 [Prosthecochloris sp.]|nr:hypothetical protein [Prosthecochloris sp.]